MKCLVTGGAGFIGRWVTATLLRAGHEVLALDDLSNGRPENLREFETAPRFLGLMRGDLKDDACLADAFGRGPWDAVVHLGASIHVQRSIDDPAPTFHNDVEGTFKVLEACRRQYFLANRLDPSSKRFDHDTDVPRLLDRRPRVAVMSTCMVYDAADAGPISELHPCRPASPYAAAKIGADALSLAYNASYSMPVTVMRPFNTYGPFQKSNTEGGVVSVFLKHDIERRPLLVKGTGAQTRDLLYVEDCADFVVRCLKSRGAEGHVVNAGTGRDVAILDLARMCCTGGNVARLVPHDHPQAEIMRLCCDYTKAERLLEWRPTTPLHQGIARTRAWLEENRWAW
jgi:UDP-glucose 4-epimerase